jgi:hypothetical protein
VDQLGGLDAQIAADSAAEVTVRAFRLETARPACGSSRDSWE